MRYAILVCLLILAGCGASRGLVQLDTADTAIRPSQDLYTIGRWLIYAGSLGAALGVVALVFTRHSLVGTAIVACLGACLLGVALSWFGQHPWAVWIVAIGTAMVVAYRHRGFLYRLFRRKEIA